MLLAGRTPMITRRRLVAACAGALACTAPGGLQSAQSQTARGTVRVLVGFPPGGTTDVIARLLASEMKDYASSVIVENRPGAGGRVALGALKTAVPDGSVFIVTPIAPITLYP